jgi:hypothetical protein
MRPQNQQQGSPFSKVERRGSAIAHASGLLIGVPILITGFLPLSLAFLPCPVVSYLIARAFRRRRKAWGAFQGMQASVVQLIIVLLAFIASLIDPASRPFSFIFAIGALVFLYSLWGAWDTLLGYDFRYIGISQFLDRVSRANLERQERRRGLFRGYRTDNQDDRNQNRQG